MPKKTKTSPSTKARRDLYQEVTDQIIEDLEKGTAPWAKPWNSTYPGLVSHRNAQTKAYYRGINQLLLTNAAHKGGFSTPLWVTYRQTQAMGGTVRKGEKSPGFVVFFKALEVEDRGRADANGDPTRKTIPLIRHSAVFNIEQTDIPCEKYTKLLPQVRDPRQIAGAERIEDLESFIAATGAQFSEGGDRAFYRRGTDEIRVPTFEHFRSAGDYYGTVLHELTHWTADKSRCDRKLGARFGDDAYAAEELVAEMGAAYLCAHFGLPGKLQHSEYLAHWLKILRGDARAIFTASNRAQAAADFLLEAAGLRVKPEPSNVEEQAVAA